MIVGLVTVFITILLKLEIGMGTIANIIIGFFIDLIIYIYYSYKYNFILWSINANWKFSYDVYRKLLVYKL